MDFTRRETVSQRGEERVKVDQNGAGINWRDPSAWVPPLVMALLMALLVRMCGINIPLYDDFDSPGWLFFDLVHGNFSWHSFWQQHNESRLVVPRVIWLVEAYTVGWSTKHWMYASVVMCAVQVYLLGLMQQKIVHNTALRWMVVGCTSLLLLHPRLAPETFLRGIQAVTLVASLFIVLGLFLYSRRISFHSKLLLYVIFGEISTLTFASGMVVWVLLFPLFPLLHELRDPSKDRKSIFVSTALACLCALLGIGSYFVDFRGTPITWPDSGLAGLLTYFFSWMGAALASIGDAHAVVAFGVGLFLTAAACVTVVTAQAIKYRSLLPLEQTWPWLMLLVYVVVLGVVNALTRTPLGINNALAERYGFITMQMSVGLAGLVPILVCYRADGSVRRHQKVRLALVSAVLLGGIFYAVAGWQYGIERSLRHHRAIVRRKIALSLWREAPFISPLPISPDVPLARRRTHYLALVRAGLSPDYSGGSWLTKALKDARFQQPVGEVRVRGAGKTLKAFGWAMDPVARTPFPAVLTVIAEQDSQLTPISVDLMNQKGPLVPGRLDTEESPFFIGFSTYPLQGGHTPAPADRLLFFAIDPEHHEAYPIQRIP